jgi:DNA-binding transcriptional MerR regulator
MDRKEPVGGMDRGGTMTVGALAKRVGVSIRTLRYYDEIGLLAPARHTAAGYRLYGAGDVARLQQIRSLRQLGFSLDEIQTILRDPAYSPLQTIELHLERVRTQTRALRHLEDRLAALAAHFRRMDQPTTEDFLRVMESMTMVEQYYTPEQLEALAKRRDDLGEAGMRQAEADWETLRAQVKAEMEAGTDPADPAVQALAAKWKSLIDAFTGGDPGIRANLQKVWENEPVVHGIDTAAERAMMEYVGKALKIANTSA